MQTHIRENFIESAGSFLRAWSRGQDYLSMTFSVLLFRHKRKKRERSATEEGEDIHNKGRFHERSYCAPLRTKEHTHTRTHTHTNKMDFELAAQRFARDHQSNRNRNRRRHHDLQNNNNHRRAGIYRQRGNSVAISAKAQREVALRKQEQERMLKQKRFEQRQRDYWEHCLRQGDRNLHIRSLGGSRTITTTTSPLSSSSSSSVSTVLTQPSSSLQLKATSIHGEGDKIALPPSVLAYLTSHEDEMGSSSSLSSPWTFRIGILNPHYTFPQSTLLQELQPPPSEDDDDDNNNDPDEAMNDNEDDDEAKMTMKFNQAYMDELSHKYLAWTHGTVVEFTQEEGYVGLPSTIASALIAQAQQKATMGGGEEEEAKAFPVTRTIDPAAAVMTTMTTDASTNQEDSSNAAMIEDETEKTPGHLAWGAFDVPNLPIEITWVQLPKGRACTLQPTSEAIQRGFYNLANIKLVLEQSLIRTRAVLSVHDQVHTWHRGVQYNLHVSQVEPADYHAVVCINTDLTVDFEAPLSPPLSTTTTTAMTTDGTTNHETMTAEAAAAHVVPQVKETTTWHNGGVGYTLSGGRTLNESPLSTTTTTSATAAAAGAAGTTATQQPPLDSLLTAEPPASDPMVCTVQIRNSTGRKPIQRRFNVQTDTVQHLFALAAITTTGSSTSSQQEQQEDNSISVTNTFQLVTRFPRRVLQFDDTRTLEEVGLVAGGQELFLMERL